MVKYMAQERTLRYFQSVLGCTGDVLNHAEKQNIQFHKLMVTDPFGG